MRYLAEMYDTTQSHDSRVLQSRTEVYLCVILLQMNESLKIDYKPVCVT